MLDVVYLSTVIVFFALALGYAWACARGIGAE
jgi:hypothetical protein